MHAQLLAQIAPDDVGSVADAVGMRGGLRVQQDARRVHRRGAHHHDLGVDAFFLAGHAVEVLHAVGQALVVHEHARDDRVAAQLQLAGLDGIGQQVVGRTEERAGVAPRAAVAAVVTRGIPAKRLRAVGAAPGDDRDVGLGEALAQQHLAAPGRRRRHVELAARQRVRVVVAAADADQLVDLVVVRRDVLVFDGPGDLPAVLGRPLEVEVRVPQADAAPDVGLAAVPPHANELEGLALRREVGLFLRVEEELRRLLAARAPRARFPRPNVRPELAALELRARVEQQDVDALARQVPGGHAAGRAAADHDDRMDFSGAGDLRHW